MEDEYRKWPERWVEAGFRAGFLRKVMVGDEVATYVADDLKLMSQLAIFARAIEDAND